MFKRIYNYFVHDYAAILFSFGNRLAEEMLTEINSGNAPGAYHRAGGRLFPGYIAITWRDYLGFNPSVSWQIGQFGDCDPHLLPNGYRLLSGRIGRAYRLAD